MNCKWCNAGLTRHEHQGIMGHWVGAGSVSFYPCEQEVTMKHAEFYMHQYFQCGPKQWYVTDIGTRTVVAIEVKQDWMKGPPYAVREVVFDENDFEGCKDRTP